MLTNYRQSQSKKKIKNQHLNNEKIKQIKQNVTMMMTMSIGLKPKDNIVGVAKRHNKKETHRKTRNKIQLRTGINQ